MRIFITGATGTIGSVVAQELIAAGHQVLGLARSDASARALGAAGIDVLHGELRDPASLRAGADAADGVMHLAFGPLDDFPQALATETFAVDTFAAALVGTGKVFVIASGTPTVAGRVATERDPALFEG